jgi:hypothetical protein
MQKLFGEEHSACMAIWMELYIDESDPRSKPAKKSKEMPGWFDRVVSELRPWLSGTDWAAIPYGSDGGKQW